MRSAFRRLPAEPRSVKVARDFVRSTMTAWGVEPDGAVLLTSELVTNAVRHARTEVVVTVRDAGPGVRIEVRDDDPGAPVLAPADVDATSGRGLSLVNHVADAWGVERHDGDGKTVWLEVASEPAADAGPR